jgi:hypothetical protein
MPVNLDGTTKGGGGGFGGGGGKKSGGTTGGSPGLLTSTGGITGLTGIFTIPFQDLLLNRFYFVTFDPTDFNCEEDVTYFFKQEDIEVGRVVTIHKVLIVYRMIGQVKFTLTLNGFLESVKSSNEDPSQTGRFVSKSVPVTFGLGLGKIPDKKLHTRSVDIKLTCERPQISISRLANSGPLAITKVIMCGTADEGQQL